MQVPDHTASAFIVVSILCWTVQCTPQASDLLQLPDVNTNGDIFASDNLDGLTNAADGDLWTDPSNSETFLGAGLLGLDSDIALTQGGDGSSCATPMGKRDDLFTPNNLILSKRLKDKSYLVYEIIITETFTLYIGADPKSCPSDDGSSTPDFSKLNIDREFTDFLQNQENSDPKDQGAPVGGIRKLWKEFNAPDCPPPLRLTCCVVSNIDRSRPAQCAFVNCEMPILTCR